MTRKEKDFGGSSDTENIPPESRNLRQSGARKQEPRPDLHEDDDPSDTGDRGDRPRRPFGLKRPKD